MSKKKYKGSWDSSSLHTLMDKGKVYVECKHCGAHIDNWVVVMSLKCHKCKQPHGITERLIEARDAKEAKQVQAPPRNRKHACLRRAFLTSHACVYSLSPPPSMFPHGFPAVEAFTGEHGWETFVRGMLLGHGGYTYTCFRCRACGYVHVAPIKGDINSANINAYSNVYFIARGTGRVGVNNWVASFRCHGCDRDNENVYVTVSWDFGTDERGDPFAEIFSWKELYLPFLRY